MNHKGSQRKEFSYSSFCRSFYVPENVNRDKIEANYKDGVLTVALPKQEEEKKQNYQTDCDLVITLLKKNPANYRDF